jgi:hypothetical protein
MMQLSALVAASGLALLVLLPTYKNRMKRLLSQGAGTSMFALGLFGILFQIVAR